MSADAAATSREELLAALRAAEERIAARDTEFDGIVESVESDNIDDEHDPEGATIAFERARVLSLRDRAIEQRDAIQRALAAMDAGTYGVCVVCGTQICDERLVALPGVETCIACAASEMRSDEDNAC